jgi:hypothetical protein
MCYPSEETLARACGVSRRTLLYWFQRSPEGRFARKVKRPDGSVHWENWTWSALQAFLRIAPKRRYDPVGQRSLKTSNRYFIHMDDPPVPEDEPLIWARAHELAKLHLQHQAEEQERQARWEDVESKALKAPSYVATDCTHNNVQHVRAQQCATGAQNPLLVTASSNPHPYRAMNERRQPAERLKGDATPAPSKKALVGGEAATDMDWQPPDSAAP